MSELKNWKPDFSFDDLDSRLENAYRRVYGALGYEISFDNGRSKAMRQTAGDMLDAGFGTVGPMFMRVGRGLLEGRGLKTGPGLALRDMAGEILREFYNEGNTAFQTVKSAACADASCWLRERGVSAEDAGKALDSADAVFLPPSREAFTQAANSYLDNKFTPSTSAIVCGIGAFALVIALLRSPHLAVFAALAGGACGFYMGRNRQRTKASAMLERLPRTLYDLLRVGLNSNMERYADVVNSAARKLL